MVSFPIMGFFVGSFSTLWFTSKVFEMIDIMLCLGWCIQGTPVNIIVGSHVWIEDPEEAWLDGEVTEIKGRDATITTSNGKTVRLPV